MLHCFNMNTISSKYLIVILLCSPAFLISQPEPCNIDNPEMTPTCGEACIICDIDGFTGRHESAVEGILPNDFCTMQVHNGQWIAFQAASTNLSIRMSVTNCEINRGLELALYASTDCDNFRMISNCLGSRDAVGPGEFGIFNNTEPLIIGQYYYLAMDGSMADNCDWTLAVIEGSTEVDPLAETPPIMGEDRFCIDTEQVYSTLPVSGATFYDWTLGGITLETTQDPVISINIPSSGSYELCVQARNVCDEASISCKNIEAYVIPVTEIADIFCEFDCYNIDGNEYCNSGTFEYSIPLINGCDSMIRLTLVELPQPINNLAFNICEGEQVFIGDIPYSSAGTYSQTLLNEYSCDSLVNLELGIIICNIESEGMATSAICNGDYNGEVVYQVTNGTPPFNYSWLHLQTNLTGTGTLIDLQDTGTITGLPAGELLIEVNDNFGNSDVIILTVDEPEVLILESTESDYNGYHISCYGASDGEITLIPTGGVSPYQYSWPSGTDGSSIQNLTAGSYVATVVDGLGCTVTTEIILTEPETLNAQVIFQDPNCDGPDSGEVSVQNIEGGVAPYESSLNSNPFTLVDRYQNLEPDSYLLEIRDANGCLFSASQELTPAEIPELSGESQYETALGCEVQILVETNAITISDISWKDESYQDCNDCIDPIAIPSNSVQNTVYVTSSDDCIDSMTINITVKKSRAFYAPNIFFPKGDSPDNKFLLYGSKEVESIDLSIYDRWGNLLYSKQKMEPIDIQNGWDGSFNNNPAEAGIYVWKGVITFIDGFVESFAGDVTLLR